MTVDSALIEALLITESTLLVLIAGVMTAATALREIFARRRRRARDLWLERVRPRLLDARSPAAVSRDSPARTHGSDRPAALMGRTSRALRRQVVAVSHLTESLSGGAAQAAVETAGPDRMVTAAEHWCRSRFWWRRLRGVRTLANLGLVGVAGIDLTAMLDDENPEVRAEAAISVPSLGVTPAAVERLVVMLDGDPRERWAAADALVRIGQPAVDALVRHLDRGPRRPDVALRVAAGIGAGRLLPTALRACRDSRPSVRAASASAVAAVGGAEATACLVRLLDDDAANVREAAARGLAILEHWPAAAALAQLLSDPVWEVRRSAAHALRLLGPAGRLHLRRAAGDSDERVAQIVRHVNDLPPSALEVRR